MEAALAIFEVDRTFFWDLRFKAITSLAESLDIVGDCKEAIPHYESALATVRGIWVERHADITKEILASNLNNLALCYKKLGEYFEGAAALPRGGCVGTRCERVPAVENLQQLEVFLNRPLTPPSAESSVEAMTLDRGAEASARPDLGTTEAYRARKYDGGAGTAARRWSPMRMPPAPVRARLLVNRATARFQLRDPSLPRAMRVRRAASTRRIRRRSSGLGRVLLASENASASAAVDALKRRRWCSRRKTRALFLLFDEAKAALEERRQQQQQQQQQHGDPDTQEDAVASGKTPDAPTGSTHFRMMVDESARLAKVFDGAVSRTGRHQPHVQIVRHGLWTWALRAAVPRSALLSAVAGTTSLHAWEISPNKFSGACNNITLLIR